MRWRDARRPKPSLSASAFNAGSAGCGWWTNCADTSAPRSTQATNRLANTIDHRHREREGREELFEGLLDEPIQQLAIGVVETRFRAMLRDES